MENIVKVAMVGFGGISKSHKHGYEKLEAGGALVKLVAICDINPEQFTKATAINIDSGKPAYDIKNQNLYTDADEMLAKEDFDMVDLCIPTFLHKKYACKFLKAGKHVLCEKPMSLSGDDCLEMLDAAKQSGKKFMIGQCLRFEPLYLFLKDAIEKNTFGKVKYAMFDRLGSQPRWGFENWYTDTSRCGGAIMDLHIHDVDMVRFLFGEPEAVSTVTYDTETKWAVINSRFRYNDDKIVVANASWDESPSRKFIMTYRVNFEKAEVIMDGSKIMVYPVSGKPYQAEIPAADRMAEEIRALVMSIIEDSANASNTPESAYQSVKLVEKLRESAALKGEYIKL